MDALRPFNRIVVGTSARLAKGVMSGSQSKHAPEIDKSQASQWVYPSNVPARQYQIDISRTALFDNTLVCLPTGLGKTLIAAVVMYNFYAWFPKGKIVFLAPTKPLVDQQREACLYQVSMKQFDTSEMTGRQKPDVRKTLWKSKRVFFCTPQVFEKDLANGLMSPTEFVCVVVDECHKSTGNYATVKAVQFLKNHNVQFRVLGLSATPGRTKAAIQDMIDNLMISAVEFRDENDPEICQHTHDKAVDAITVHPQPELSSCYRMLQSVLETAIDPLLKAGVLNVSSAESVTRYALVSAQQSFKLRSRQFRNAPRLTAVFNHGIFLTSIGENLDCGIRTTLDYINASLKEKGWLKEIPSKHPTFNQLTGTLERLIASEYEHPKFQKLMEVLLTHFAEAPDRSRVIIFTSLRETVFDIVDNLTRRNCPDITAKCFSPRALFLPGQLLCTGKNKMTQPEQKRVLQEFREGKFNVLVATCIAEEGLDIPEVQLIVCYDGAASPLRDVQRMGRTGRHSEGHVVYLLAEGKERRKYDRNNNESGYIKNLLRKALYHFQLNENNPRMIPADTNPEMTMVKMETTHPKEIQGKKRVGTESSKSHAKQTRLDSFVSSSPEQKRETITGKEASDVICLIDEDDAPAVIDLEEEVGQGVQAPASVSRHRAQSCTAATIVCSTARSARTAPVTSRKSEADLSPHTAAPHFPAPPPTLKSQTQSTNPATSPKVERASTDEGHSQPPPSSGGDSQSTSALKFVSEITKRVFLDGKSSSALVRRSCSTKKSENMHQRSSVLEELVDLTNESADASTPPSSPPSSALIIRRGHRHPQRKQKVLCNDSTASKKRTSALAEHQRRENEDPNASHSFLDLDAEVSESEGSGEEEEVLLQEEMEELELFIDDSESIPEDAISMMEIYRRSLSETPAPTSRPTRSIHVTPGATPFSEQSSYESSFVTDGSGTRASVSVCGGSTVDRPRVRLCEICHQRGKFISCSQCNRHFHIVCITLRTSLSGEWICDTCRAHCS